ncbi:MAG: hypothetical protein AAGH79_12670 [Bacteroidota bacterium]
MKRILLIIVAALFLLVVIGGLLGVRYFHNLWFQDKPNYFVHSESSNFVPFLWSSGTYGDYEEPQDAIMIPVQIRGFDIPFYLQFDTGAPSSILYQNTLESLRGIGLDYEETIIEERSFVKGIPIQLADQNLSETTFWLREMGEAVDTATLSEEPIKLGTIGADWLDQKVVHIDFINQQINQYNQRPDWMQDLAGWHAFSFQGRRFMLPTTIEGKVYDLFYDSGSSAFGLITTHSRYQKYAIAEGTEISYNANSWGNPVYVHHKATTLEMGIGGADVPMNRVSYVNMYARWQGFLAIFSKIGGWLGNKPFLDTHLILDTQTLEFLVLPRGSNELILEHQE